MYTTPMPIIPSSAAPTFNKFGIEVVSLAAPCRGAAETCVWRLTLPPHAPDAPHSLDREEIFVGLSGSARVALDGEDARLGPGDTLVVPAGHTFSLSNPSPEPFTALVVLPVGGQARMPGGEPFAPPWTL
jgi:mannose-6-phosphate isomerase-like protein (cupin superfamily)